MRWFLYANHASLPPSPPRKMNKERKKWKLFAPCCRYHVRAYSLRVLGPVTQADAGTYHCHATNTHGDAWRNFTVTVVTKHPVRKGECAYFNVFFKKSFLCFQGVFVLFHLSFGDYWFFPPIFWFVCCLLSRSLCPVWLKFRSSYIGTKHHCHCGWERSCQEGWVYIF